MSIHQEHGDCILRSGSLYGERHYTCGIMNHKLNWNENKQGLYMFGHCVEEDCTQIRRICYTRA